MVLTEISVLNKTYYQRNYLEVLKLITPDTYFDHDLSISGEYVDPIDQLINTHLDVANDVATIFNISATDNVSSINTVSGFAPYFVRQNGLTLLTPYLFEKNILTPLGRTFSEFSTSGEFKTYVDNVLLPSIRLNHPTAGLADSASGSHEYLINNLTWLYFLNTSAAGGLAYEPSSYVSDQLVHKLYKGETVRLKDGIKGLENYLWRNSNVCSFDGYIPTWYTSSVNSSGIQQLETLIDVAYNTFVTDRSDSYIREAFDNYIGAGLKLNTKQSAGPFSRLLQAIAYAIYELNAEVEETNTYTDIESISQELLPFLAGNIGWELVTNNIDSWRAQLRRAVEVYKAKGTKRAIQTSLNTVLPSSIFDPVSGLAELYESYIPYIIYYSLLTESDLFASGYNSWTPTIAKSLGVSDFTTTSFDTNIRYAVDTIILNLVKKFPGLFRLGGRAFDINDPDFVFRYRNRLFKVPPWEDFKYYKNQQVTPLFLEELKEQLACFGVRQSFIIETINYIASYTTLAEGDLVTVGNGWLFFTPSSNLPPNFDDIVEDTVGNKSQYLSLWNGKSSHFKIQFNASDYTFSSTSYEANSHLSIIANSRFINQFAPFHSIPEVLLYLDADTEELEFADSSCILLDFLAQDVPVASAAAAGGWFTSGVDMGALANAFRYSQVDSPIDTYHSTSAALPYLPRTAVRRRNFYNLIPMGKVYLANGLSNPTEIVNVVSANDLYTSGFLIKGFNYSGFEFASALDPVWGKCQKLYSSGVFSGVPTSSTYPLAGSGVLSSLVCDKYVTAETAPILAVMWAKTERDNYNNASAIPEFNADGSAYNASASFLDIQRSNANSSSILTSFDYYNNFQFGRKIQKYYKDYSNFFNRIGRKKDIENSDGRFDAFSHTFGPLVYNFEFEIDGSALTTSAQYNGSSIVSPEPIKFGTSGVLSTSGATVFNTQIVSSVGDDFYVRNFEFRNPYFISGVELVTTSGVSNKNSFELFKFANESTVVGGDNFIVNNRFIKNTAINGFDRLRISVADYGPDTNKLSPDHKFSINLSALLGNASDKSYGDGVVGIWIHTKPERGKVWSYVPWENFDDGCRDKKDFWIQTNTSSLLSQKFVIDNLSHLYNIPKRTPDQAVACFIDGNIGAFGGLHIDDMEVDVLTLNFDTINRHIRVPGAYHQELGLVHRPDQKYIIEIFRVAENNPNKFTLFFGANMRDETLYDYVREYEPLEVFDITRFFNSISTGKIASRVAANTESVMGPSGGSRLNYREHPAWSGGSLDADNEYTQGAGPIELIN